MFDHGWAEAFERAGGAYYPKLQVVGAVHPGRPARACWRARTARGGGASGACARRWCELTNDNDLSSAHVTFLPSREATISAQRGFLQRTDQQFHWENDGYADVRRLSRPRSPRASARPSAASARRRCRAGIDVHWLTGTGPHRRASGTRSSPSTWRPARANGAGLTSPASSSRSSAQRWATASCW